jgi:hypothetical protein
MSRGPTLNIIDFRFSKLAWLIINIKLRDFELYNQDFPDSITTGLCHSSYEGKF